MEGGKALALEAWCGDEGRGFLRFDYTGHGLSSGNFEDGTIGQWAADAVFAIGALTSGPAVLVGSSMGGWIMMLAARALPHRVAGLVGIAPAPDFTEDLMMANASAAMREALERNGVHYEPSAYNDEPTPITRKLIDDGRERLVLRAPFRLCRAGADHPGHGGSGRALAPRPESRRMPSLAPMSKSPSSSPATTASPNRTIWTRLIRTTGEVCRLVASPEG